MRNVSVAWIGPLLMAAFACGGEETQTTSQTTVIAATGGTVTAGGATLVIPAGALSEDTTITVTISSPRSSLPDSSTVKGSIFDFGPDGTTFSTPATLTLPMDGTPAANERAVISFLDPVANQWVDLTSTVTGTDISAPVSHFTEHASRFRGLIPGLPTRIWTFDEILSNGARRFKSGSTQIFGTLNATINWGAAVRDQGVFDVEAGSFGPSDGNADGQIYSSEGGGTFVVSTEAANQVDLVPNVAIGNTAILVQKQSFLKTAADASLTFDIINVDIEGIDRNPTEFEYAECPVTPCPPLIMGKISLLVTAHTGGVIPQGVCAVDEDCPEGQDCDDNLCFKPHKYIFHAAGVAQVKGDARGWVPFVDHKALSDNALWDLTHFNFVFANLLGQISLKEHLSYTLDLSEVDVGEQFTFEISAAATVEDRRMGKDRDSSVYAFLRDPLSIGGTTVTTVGLEPTNDPQPAPPLVHVPAPPCIPGPSPAGVLQFSAGSYNLAEWAGDDPVIIVTRTGGSGGAVSATFTTSDGTATTGADYTPVSAVVTFADGDTANWVIPISIVHDLVPEPDKTVNLTLSEPGGCATLGPQSTAVLTIQDDDRPPPDGGSFTIGGTVTGLVGTGLVLQNLGGNDLTPGNGPFAFSILAGTGAPYNVTVAAQPTNPNQTCTVANGSGTVAGADVTNVTVTCVTPDTTPGLDPLFGSGGKVTTGMAGGATAMALQTDGKIVLIGGKTLARYNTDGSPDSSFGTVTVLMGTAQAVAIQPDGKIVVAGFSRTTTQDDFAVERYDGNGILDTSFGGGLVTTDFNGSLDKAWAVLVQTDGKIVVAGHAAISTPLGSDSDFAVARYTSTGDLDMSFGILGKVTTNIAGRTDLASAAALQPDGGIVVTGRVSDDAVRGDVGLVRYDSGGNPDAGFGMQGIVSTVLAGFPSDVALQPDGKILVSARALVGGHTVFGVVRFEGDGDVDTGFGSGGLATAAFSTKDDYPQAVAVQSGGEIVMAGQSSNLMNPDFAIARFSAAGTLDGSFDGDGKLTVDFFDSSDGAECAKIQADGKIVVGGFARNGTTTGLGLVRVLP